MTSVQIIYFTDPLKKKLAKNVDIQRIIFNIFQLTTTEAMSSYEDRFVQIRVVFHALYFENEVGDSPFFFSFLIKETHYLTVAKVCVVEVFRANVLKSESATVVAWISKK